MSWIVWIGTPQNPPEPFLRFRTIAEIKGLQGVEVFIREGADE